MGALISTSVSNTKSEIKRETKNIIEFEGQKNQCVINQGGITLSGLKGVHVGNIKITQKCTVSGQTYYKALLKALTKLSTKLDEKTKAALGLSISNTSTDIKNKVENIMKLKCGNSRFISDVDKIQILDSSDSTFDGIVVEQTGNVKGKCNIDAVLNAIANDVVEAKKTTTGSSVAGLLFGGLPMFVWYIIAAVLGVGLLGGIYKYTQKNKEKRGSSYKQQGGLNYYNYVY